MFPSNPLFSRMLTFCKFASTLLPLAIATFATAQSAAPSPAQLFIQPGTISTIAGQQNGATGYNEGQSATTAGLYIYGMVVDKFGNVYIVNNQSYAVSVVPSGNGGLANLSALNPAAPTDPADPSKPDQSKIKGNIYTYAGQLNNPCSSQPGCGEGVLATASQLGNPQDIVADTAGNLYIADTVTGIRRVDATTGVMTTVVDNGSSYYSIAVDYSGTLLAVTDQSPNAYEVSVKDGTLTQVVGGGSNVCSTGPPCGDGGPAADAQMNISGKPAFDGVGNLYIADLGYYGGEIRRIDAKTRVISSLGIDGNGPPSGVTPAADGFGDGGPVSSSYLSPNGIYDDPDGNVFLASNSFGSVREVSVTSNIVQAIAGVSFGYNPNACGGTDTNGNLITQCGDSGPATNATFGSVAWYSQDMQGNGYIGDNSPTTELIRFVTAGSSTYDFNTLLPGQPAPILTPGQPALAMEIGTSYDPNNGIALTAVPLNYTLNNSGGSPLSISALTFVSTSTTQVPSGTFAQAPSGGKVRGSAVPGLQDCVPGLVLAPNAACAVGVSFTPLTDAQTTGTLTITSNASNAVNGDNVITFTGSGTNPAGTKSQTITFSLPANATFGSSLPLTGTATSNLPVYYVVTGAGKLSQSGTTLVPTGTGAVTVTAYQFGNTNYAEASPVQASVMVAAQPITVKANSFPDVPIGGPIPALTYTVYLGSGTAVAPQGATTGAPALTTTATSSSPPGQYPITIMPGTLAAAPGYSLNPITSADDATLYIGGTTPEIVNFAPVGQVTYGVAPITLSATAVDSSGKPVPNQNISYSITSGPATVAGALLTITGAGPVTIVATQPADNTYTGATAAQTITVDKSPLDVKADNQNVVVNQSLPTLTYTITGFVDGDTPAATVTGVPTLTTTATATSPIGSYPITVTSLGNLTATNYTFKIAPNPGTLSIIQGLPQTISFAAPPSVIYGVSPISLIASASSGLGVSFQVAGGPATITNGNVLSVLGVGTISVTATQAGFGSYGAAPPVTQSFTVSPALLTFTAGNVSRPMNTANPDLSGDWSVSGLVNGDSNSSAFSGTPVLSTTALPGSPPGSYPINISGQDESSVLASTNYIFVFVPGTITITEQGPAASFSITAAPPSVTVVHGALAPLTLTLTPNNYYQGTINLSCGSLPANVTCVFADPQLSADGSGSAMQTVLTINTGPAAVVSSLKRTSPGQTLPAGILLIPGFAAGILIAFRRRTAFRRGWLQAALIILVLAGSGWLEGCGSSKSNNVNNGVAASGTTTIVVTGSGSTGSVSSSVALTLTVN